MRIKQISSVSIVLFVMSLMVFTGIASAKEPATPELTLNEAINMAISRSNQLQKAKLEIERTEELRRHQSSQLNFIPIGIPNNPPAEVAWSRFLTANLEWEMSKRSLSLEEDRLLLDVCQRYWNVLTFEEKLKSKSVAVQQAELELRRVRALERVGIVPKLGLIQAEAGYEAAKATQISAENELTDAYVKFNSITGLWPQDRPQLVDAIEYHPLEVNSLESEVQRVLDASPTVWLSQERATMQKHLENLTLYTGEYRPYQARKIEVQQAERDTYSTQELTRVLTRSLYYKTKKLEENYSSLAHAIAVAEENLRVTKIKYELGMITKAEVSAAEKALAEARENLVAVEAQHAYLKLAFYKPWAMGAGS